MIGALLMLGAIMALTLWIVIRLRLGVSGTISIVVGVGAVMGYNFWAGLI